MNILFIMYRVCAVCVCVHIHINIHDMTNEHCPISDRKFWSCYKNSNSNNWGCSPKPPLFEYKTDIILRNRHWQRHCCSLFHLVCFSKKIILQSSQYNISLNFGFFFSLISWFLGGNKGWIYVLKPRTPNIPPKIGQKCPFWRVVQLSRRVPLVVTFAIFIITWPDFGDFFRSTRSVQISSELQ